MNNHPLLILLFSGKRKSGKDYVTDVLMKRLNPQDTVILKISAPIKSYWAKANGVSLDELLSAGTMKELFRQQMITWSEKKRDSDHGVFCREAIQMYEAEDKPIWIVSDIRRKTDISWFRAHYPSKVKTIRVNASEESRKKRGWSFIPGIDDAATECDLDNVEIWDFTVDNDGKTESLEEFFKIIKTEIDDTLKP